MHSAQHMEACPGTALSKNWTILENLKFSIFFSKLFFHFFSTFQNCPKIDQRQPNAFRATYGSVSSDGLAQILDNFGVSKKLNFFKNFFEIFLTFQNCPKIVHRQPNAFRATYGSVSSDGLAHFLDNFVKLFFLVTF
jgi:hypothetical protein